MIANYVLSNLRNDVIRIENNSLQHGLLSVSSPQDNVEMMNIIPRLQYSLAFLVHPQILVEFRGHARDGVQ